MTFVACGEEFFSGHSRFAPTAAQREEPFDGCLARVRICGDCGDKVGNGLAVPGDRKAFAPFHGTQQFCQMRFGFRRLNLFQPHDPVILTSQTLAGVGLSSSGA
jgi:hypothetical protein